MTDNILPFTAKHKDPKAKPRVQDTLTLGNGYEVDVEIFRDMPVFLFTIGALALFVELDKDYKDTGKVVAITAYPNNSPILLIGSDRPLYGLSDMSVQIQEIHTVIDHIVGSIIGSMYSSYLKAVVDSPNYLLELEAKSTKLA